MEEKIKEKYPTTAIIFMIGHFQYIYDIFKVQPCGFVKKPVKKENVAHVFKIAVQLYDTMPVFYYKSNKSFYKVYLKDIYYIISQKRQIILKTAGNDKMYYGKLDETETELQRISSNFMRIGQSVQTDYYK